MHKLEGQSERISPHDNIIISYRPNLGQLLKDVLVLVTETLRLNMLCVLYNFLGTH